MSTDVQILYCTCPDEATAGSIARTLVSGKLAACVNIIPQLTSVYAWNGNIQEDSEVLLLIKSSADQYPALERAVLDAHPYELPEIIAVPVEQGFPAYLDWVVRSTSE